MEEKLEWPVIFPEERGKGNYKNRWPMEVDDNSPDPLVVQALKSKIVKIIQDPILKSQTINSTNKTLQIQANIQLIGDRAIEAGLSTQELFTASNCIEAMEYLLDHIPEPKLETIKALAVAAAIKRKGQLNPAAAELGISGRAIRYLKNKAIELGLPIMAYLNSNYWKYWRGSVNNKDP